LDTDSDHRHAELVRGAANHIGFRGTVRTQPVIDMYRNRGRRT
jgi:hypothetical protein